MTEGIWDGIISESFTFSIRVFARSELRTLHSPIFIVATIVKHAETMCTPSDGSSIHANCWLRQRFMKRATVVRQWDLSRATPSTPLTEESCDATRQKRSRRKCGCALVRFGRTLHGNRATSRKQRPSCPRTTIDHLDSVSPR